MDCTDYTLDYESSDAMLVDDNEQELQKSFREILPSEGHRKKVQHENVLASSAEADAAALGE